MESLSKISHPSKGSASSVLKPPPTITSTNNADRVLDATDPKKQNVIIYVRNYPVRTYVAPKFVFF